MNEELNLLFRIIAIFLFFARIAVWRLEEKRTVVVKPITRYTFRSFDYRTVSRLAISLLHLIVLLQLFGWEVFTITQNILVFQMIGIFIAIVAFTIGVMARKELGANWAHATDYQIKRKHELVTTGIYHYIRHPIYTSISLFIIGCELVALSYLFIPLSVILFVASYFQAAKEEHILKEHFGKQYVAYAKRSKMLLPYLF
jgi:protein-S-isoprenylcysteine O-methyltransferase Ste14